MMSRKFSATHLTACTRVYKFSSHCGIKGGRRKADSQKVKLLLA